MSVYASQGDATDFKPVPAGTHAARCFQVIDLGTQKVEFQGQIKHQHKVRIGWELPDEKTDDGKPMMVSKRYTLSLHEKAALRHDLEGWRGRAFTDEELKKFDLTKLLTAPCLLTVIHDTRDGKTYARVNAISKLPKGMAEVPALTNAPVQYSIEDGANEVFSKLSPKLQATISGCREWQAPEPEATETTAPTETPADEDVPF